MAVGYKCPRKWQEGHKGLHLQDGLARNSYDMGLRRNSGRAVKALPYRGSQGERGEYPVRLHVYSWLERRKF